ncbi:MAG: cytochrome c oxidase subunit 3 [Candidatus Thermoplasmatota archaeon]|nr:cytochrome c oxidase subunit 3 [Candidatus Thermoplasmatota archaeon]
MSYGHDDHHDDHHGWHTPHNSWAPILLAFGSSFFLLGFTKVFTQSWDGGAWEYAINTGEIWGMIAGLAIFFAGLGVFWTQDWGHDGSYEAKARGVPFRGIDVRKVAVWMFLMSEMMVFSSLFSTYIRYRSGIDNCEALHNAGTLVDGEVCWLPASYFIAEGGWHQETAHAALGFMPDTLIPGAINTFALIVSSYTIVLALKAAKNKNLSDAERSRKVGMYLLTTLILATLFLVFKMIEWFVGFEIGSEEHPIFYSPSLLADGFTIHASDYTYQVCSEWHDHHCVEGAMTTYSVDVRMAASTFYVTTGTHGVHVFGGMVALVYMVIKAFQGGYTPQNAVSIEYFGLYWHFVDLVWVLVFPGFYLY